MKETGIASHHHTSQDRASLRGPMVVGDDISWKAVSVRNNYPAVPFPSRWAGPRRFPLHSAIARLHPPMAEIPATAGSRRPQRSLCAAAERWMPVPGGEARALQATSFNSDRL